MAINKTTENSADIIKEDDGSRSKVYSASKLLSEGYAKFDKLQGIETPEEQAKRIIEQKKELVESGKLGGIYTLSLGYELHDSSEYIAKRDALKEYNRALLEADLEAHRKRFPEAFNV